MRTPRTTAWTQCIGPSVLCLLLPMTFAGCGTSSDGDGAEATTKAAAAAADAPEGRLFTPEMVRGDNCPALSAGDVAETAGLAASHVSADPAVACLYSWAGGSAIVTFRVHRTVERARTHFASFTGDTISHYPVSGIGEEASHDGRRITARVANLTFDVAARTRDVFDPSLSSALGRRVESNLNRM